MKTFAASAVLAAAASAVEVEPVVDFVAGFIYGVTGENHLTEIEACYQGGDQVLVDTLKAMKDAEDGDYFKAIKEAGEVWTEFGATMTACENMGDDVDAIEAWAKIFIEPVRLAKTVGKHWLFHGSQIKADIAKEQADWTAEAYFDAGMDIADALTLAVGPIQSDEMANFSLKPELDFVGGLLAGLVQDNHLTEISTCVTDSESVVNDVEKLVSDIKAGNKIKAAMVAKRLVGELPTTLSACEGMGDDLKAIENWAKIFASPKVLVEDISKHMILHHGEIMDDLHLVETDWAAKEYYASGKAAADLLTVAVGPIEAPTSASKVDLDLLMLPELAAGFVYGMVGDNHLQEMETCYAGVTPLYGYLDAALTDIEQFKIFKAIEQLESFVFHFQMDVAPCTQMGDDIAAIEQWAQIFKSPKTLALKISKHYMLHKKAVKADITAVRTDWANKSYFSVGKDAADLVTVLIGSIE